MKKSHLLGALCVCAISIGMTAATEASLTEVDWKTAGDGLITQDSESGLEWLDMSQTVARSYTDISSNFDEGGDFEGWRYATTVEVAGLIDAAGGDGLYFNWPINNNEIQDISVVSLLGSLLGYTDERFDPYIYAMTSDTYKDCSGVYESDPDKKWLHLIQPNYPAPGDGYISLNSTYSYIWWDSINVGSFLVRESAISPIPPTLSIIAPGGANQECSDVGGSNVPINAQITLDNSDALDAVSWTLDGNPVASGETVEIFAPLGMHTVEATVTTVLGQSATASATIVVEDTIAPAITAGFTDAKTGEVIVTISSRDKVVPFYSITDDCDDSPTVITATAGVPADKVDTLSAKTDKKESAVNVSIKGITETVELTVTARDASENMSSSKAELIIVP